MSDGVHTNTLVSIVFGVEINKRVIKLEVRLEWKWSCVDDHVKHIKPKTEGALLLFEILTSTPLLPSGTSTVPDNFFP